MSPKSATTHLLKKVLSVFLACVLAHSSMVAQEPPQALIGNAVPDEFFHAVVNSLHQYLAAKAQNYSGDKDDNGSVMSPSTKQGLILVHDLYVRDLSNFRTYLAGLLDMQPDVQDKLIASLVKGSDSVEAAYHNLQGAENYFNPLKPEQSEMAAKGRYDSTMREAAQAEASGNTALAATLRREADQTPFGYLVRCRVAFYNALDKNPLFGAQIKGWFSNSTYLFDAFAHSSGKPSELRGLFRNYITDFIRQTDAEIKRANEIDQTSALTEFSGPKYVRQQQDAASLFGEFGRLLINDIQGHYGAFTSNKAVGEMATDILVTLAVCAATATGVFAPVAATLALGGITGIQIYKEGEQWYLAEVENSNVENGAGALGYFRRIDSANAAYDARLSTFLALAALIPQLPELKAAMGSVGNIKIVRQATVAVRGGRNAVNASGIGRAINAAGDRAATVVNGWVKAWQAGNSTAETANLSQNLMVRLKAGAQAAYEYGFDENQVDRLLGTALNNSPGNAAAESARKTLLAFNDVEPRALRAYHAGLSPNDITELVFGGGTGHDPAAWVTKTNERLRLATQNARTRGPLVQLQSEQPATGQGTAGQFGTTGSSSGIYRGNRPVNLNGYNPRDLDALTADELTALSNRVNELTTDAQAQHLKPFVDAEIARRRAIRAAAETQMQRGSRTSTQNQAPTQGSGQATGASSNPAGPTGTQYVRGGADIVRGAHRAGAYRLSEQDIALALREAQGAAAAAARGDWDGFLAGVRSRNLLEGVDELEGLTDRATRAGVSRNDIDAAFQRAARAGTLDAYGDSLPSELEALIYLRNNVTFLADSDRIADLSDVLGAVVNRAEPLAPGSVGGLQDLHTKLNALRRGELVSFSDREVNALRWVRSRADSNRLYYYLKDDRQFIRLFNEDNLHTLGEFLDATNFRAVKDGVEPLATSSAAVQASLPPAPLSLQNPATGSWITASDVASLTPQQLQSISPAVVDSLGEGPLKTALTQRLQNESERIIRNNATGTPFPPNMLTWAKRARMVGKGASLAQKDKENNATFRQSSYTSQSRGNSASNLQANEAQTGGSVGAAGSNGGAMGGSRSPGGHTVSQPELQPRGGGAKPAGAQQKAGAQLLSENASAAPQDDKGDHPVRQEKPERPEDFKSPKPWKQRGVTDAKHWSVTICVGDDFKFPIKGGEANIRNIHSKPFTDGERPSATGSESGNAINLSGRRTGSTTVSFDVIPAGSRTGERWEVWVDVIDCNPPKNAVTQGANPVPPGKKNDGTKTDGGSQVGTTTEKGHEEKSPETSTVTTGSGGKKDTTKCPDDECKQKREELDQAISARSQAQDALDAATAQLRQDDIAINSAINSLAAASTGWPNGTNSAVTNALQSATAARNALESDVQAKEQVLAKAKEAEKKAQEALDKCEEEAKKKCSEKPGTTTGEGPKKGNQDTNKPDDGNKTIGSATTTGGGAPENKSDSTNVVGSGSLTADLPACKRSDHECDALRKDAEDKAIAAEEAQRRLPEADSLEGEARSEDSAANNDHETAIVFNSYNTEAASQKQKYSVDADGIGLSQSDKLSEGRKAERMQSAQAEGDKAAAAKQLAGLYEASAEAHKARAKALRDQAKALREQAAAAKAAAKAAEEAYHNCMNRPPCPETQRVSTGNIILGGEPVVVREVIPVEQPRMVTSSPFMSAGEVIGAQVIHGAKIDEQVTPASSSTTGTSTAIRSDSPASAIGAIAPTRDTALSSSHVVGGETKTGMPITYAEPVSPFQYGAPVAGAHGTPANPEVAAATMSQTRSTTVAVPTPQVTRSVVGGSVPARTLYGTGARIGRSVPSANRRR